MPGIDSSPSTVATSALQAIPYSALIGGPLDACIKAQATAAMTTVDFIRQVGFRKNAKGEDEVVNVAFQYAAEGQTFNLVVPLLAIVPIPYIGIDQITIDFKANIAAASSSVSEESSAASFDGGASGGAQLGWGPFSIKIDFKANYSSKKDSKATQRSKYSVEYTMDVHVAASKSDMPAGLARVLNILESNITRLSARGTIDARPNSLPLEAGKPATVDVRVLDGHGLPVSGATLKAAAGFKLGAEAKTNEDGIAHATIELVDAAKAEEGRVLEVTLPDEPGTRYAPLRVQLAKKPRQLPGPAGDNQ